MKGRAGRPHCKLTRKYLAAGLSLADAQLAANRERSRGYYHKSPHPFSLWRRSEDRREKHRKHMQDMRQKQRDGKLLYEAKQLWLIPPPQGGW